MRAALIVNPLATRVTPELVAAVERELRVGGPLLTHLTEGPGHAATLAADASERCDRLYVFSGDGGFNEAVNGAAGDVAVGFVPGGGTSVLPRALGLPRDPVQCARFLAREAAPRRISLGRVEAAPAVRPPGLVGGESGRRFAFSAGLGLDAELVREIDLRGRAGGRRPGDPAFAGALARMLLAHRGRFDPALTVLGRGRAAFALVANCDPYTYAGPFGLHVAPKARFELGLDLVAPAELRARRLPRAALAALRRGGRHPDWIIAVHDADDLRVECDAPTPLQVDGEDLGDVTDAVFRSERLALVVLAPPG